MRFPVSGTGRRQTARPWAVRLVPLMVAALMAIFASVAFQNFSAPQASAAPGDLVGSVTFSVDCTNFSELGVGIAYDGTNLWYSCFDQVTDLYRADPNTGVVDAFYDIVPDGGLGALAYDATRNVIWAGEGGGGPAGEPVYRIDLDAGKNVVGSVIAFNVADPNVCDIDLDDGLAFDARNGADPTDDVIYYNNDCGNLAIRVFDLSGNPVESFAWGGSGCYNSGLAIGGQLLYQGSDGCSHVWVVDKTSKAPAYDFSTVVPADPNFRDEDLECDTNTFALDVIWSKEAYNPQRAHAFEIERGTCAIGGVGQPDIKKDPALANLWLCSSGALTCGPAFDRIAVAAGKPAGQAFKLAGGSFTCQSTGETVDATFKDHDKNVNPGDPDNIDHEIWSGTFSTKCINTSSGVEFTLDPVDPGNSLLIKECRLENTASGHQASCNVNGNPGGAGIGQQTFTATSEQQPDPQGIEEVNLAIRLNDPITTVDPKCLETAGNGPTPAPCLPQQIGALDFEVRYDAKFLTLSVTSAIEGMECLENQMEGTLQVICVTKGKPEDAPTGPATIAVLHVRATPDVYSILIANQGNGIATQLINQDCNLSDLQGHPIKTDLCEDAAITIRYLEGDVHADCVVDAIDQQQIAFRMFARLGNLLYNSRYDLEPSAPSKGDGDIDAKDVQFVFGRHVSTCKAPWPPQDPVDPKAKLPEPPPNAD